MQNFDAASGRMLILGAGAVVTEYYLPALRYLGWQHKVLIADPSPEALRRVHAKATQVGLRQEDFHEALAEVAAAGDFDTCVVALPNTLHDEATRLALERGLHVLCEKPLALTGDACRELARVARAQNRTLAVGMVRRLLPSFGMLREALGQSLIGRVTGIEIEDGESYTWTSDSGAAFRKENGGVLADMGVHYLDLIEEVGGDLEPVNYADDSRGGVEANADFELRTRGGVPIRMRLSRTHRLRNMLVCRGERGELVAEKDHFAGCVWRSYQTGRVTQLVPNTEWSPTLEACFARLLLEFVNRVQQGSPPMVSAERTASTIGHIEWAYRRRDESHSTRYSVAEPEAERPVTVAYAETQLPPGRVCITGATGFIGTHLVERLGADAKHDIVAPVRSYRTCARIARFPLAMPRVNLLDYNSVRAAVLGARVVFHLAYGRDGPQPERVTLEGTRNVVDAAVEAGCEAVVVLSTIYVFGRPAAEVDESWSYQPIGGLYGTSKALMESWCLRRAQSASPTRIVVLCPSCVYGAGGETYTALPVRMAREGGFCWIDGGRGIANYTYVENLVDAMLLAATANDAHGRRFIINDGTTTWRTFLRKLLGRQSDGLPSYTRHQLRELHRRRWRPSLVDVARIAMADQGVRTTLRETRLGEAALWTAERAAPGIMARLRRRWHAVDAFGEQQLPRDGGGTSVNSTADKALPPEWLADLFGPSQTVFRSDTARHVLGWSPRVTLEEGMQATRAWLEANM